MSGTTAAKRALALSTCLLAGSAAADEPDFSGSVATDFRASLGAPVRTGYEAGPDQGDLIWNLNTAEFRLKQRLNPHIRYEAHLRLQFDGLSLAGRAGDPARSDIAPLADLDGWDSLDGRLGDLTNSLTLDPFWIESDAAYVEVRNLFDGFDLVFGRQIVTWGASDRFRPTNNLNPDDLWDPLRFGITQANEMIRMLYNPTGDLILEAVVIPSFRPARLPASAAAALSDPYATPPLLDDGALGEVLRLREQMDGLGLVFDDTIALVDVPDTSLENLQAAARILWRSGDLDMSLSYFYGFDDFPHPVRTVNDVQMGFVDTFVLLAYPRMHVVGFDIAGSIGFLDDAGFRLEGALFYPDETSMTVALPDMLGRDDIVGRVVDGRPYLKATFGIDYTFTRDIFALLMLVHGFLDEMGPHLVGDFADSAAVEVDGDIVTVPLGPRGLGDYVVAGTDIKFLNGKLLLRLFGVVSLDTDHFSAVAFPLLQWNPWGSMELEAGGYVLFGDRHSKFGQPAAGDSLAFLRSRVRF